MVGGLEVCGELTETNAYVDDDDEGFTDAITGAPHVRDDVAKARAEEMVGYDKFEAHEEVRDETCLSRTGGKPISCRCKDVNKGDHERVDGAESAHRV